MPAEIPSQPRSPETRRITHVPVEVRRMIEASQKIKKRGRAVFDGHPADVDEKVNKFERGEFGRAVEGTKINSRECVIEDTRIWQSDVTLYQQHTQPAMSKSVGAHHLVYEKQRLIPEETQAEAGRAVYQEQISTLHDRDEVIHIVTSWLEDGSQRMDTYEGGPLDVDILRDDVCYTRVV